MVPSPAGLHRLALETIGDFLKNFLGNPPAFAAQPRLLWLVAGRDQRFRNGYLHRSVVPRHECLGRGIGTRIRLEPDPVGLRLHLYQGGGRSDGPDRRLSNRQGWHPPDGVHRANVLLLISAPLVGWMRDVQGTYTDAFIVMVLTNFAGAACFILAKRPQRKPAPQPAGPSTSSG